MDHLLTDLAQPSSTRVSRIRSLMRIATISQKPARASSTARITPEHTTLISAALAALAERPVSSARITGNGRSAILGHLPPQLELIIRVDRQRRKCPRSNKPLSIAADKMLAANRRSTRLGGLFKGAT
jgi:hypothetical protein